MAGLVGEYECKIDAKGRFLFPSGLRKQLSPLANEVFMLNKGFENCLTLYAMNEWDKVSINASGSIDLLTFNNLIILESGDKLKMQCATGNVIKMTAAVLQISRS